VFGRYSADFNRKEKGKHDAIGHLGNEEHAAFHLQGGHPHYFARPIAAHLRQGFLFAPSFFVFVLSVAVVLLVRFFVFSLVFN
jgi:hypothetical protein